MFTMRHPHAVSLATSAGLKTSTAFFTSLSANLRLPEDDLYPSPMNTPLLRATASHVPIPPPSPLTAAMTLSRDPTYPAAISGGSSSRKPIDEASTFLSPPAIPDDLPTLSTYAPTDKDEKVDALKLVADSVAQQRQTASRALLFHPLTSSLYVAFLGFWFQRFLSSDSALDVADYMRFATTVAGVSIACLVAVRYLTEGYIREAETIKWEWLGDDQVLVTKWGSDVIAALVLGWARDEGKGRKKKGGRGVIRAWTVKMRYRGKGVGRALLEEAVELVAKKGGDGIEFADDHANSARILKPLFNKKQDRDELRAYDSLQKVVEEKGVFHRSRRQRTP